MSGDVLPRVNGEGYFISRSTEDDNYGLWRFDPHLPELLAPLPLRAGARFDRRHQLLSVGDYLLEWGPLALENYAPSYAYRLLRFDAKSDDPLALERTSVQRGAWARQKFWGTVADFGNPNGARRQFDEVEALSLVPCGSFLMNLILTPGRGTFCLWNFDPGSSDPLPGWQTPPGAFETIQLGSELIPLRDYVLDRTLATGEYKLWSLDPQSNIPLSRPALQQGSWHAKGIDSAHRLVPIGDFILDWVPADRGYRLWKFDPARRDPLGEAPVASGHLPEAIARQPSLFGFMTKARVRTELAGTPGTIDFMRSKIKHVVYYILENRSFDHVCGWLYERGEENVRFVGPKGPFRGARTSYSNPSDERGVEQRVHLSKYRDGKLSVDYPLDFLSEDPYHNHSDVMRQLFHGQPGGYEGRAVPGMEGFIWNNGTPAIMQTYSPEQLPVLNGLARHFAVSDEWFCSTPGPTDPTRAFALTGSSFGLLDNFQNGSVYQNWPSTPRRPSIWKALWANGITDFKIYNSVEWMTFVFSYHLFLQGQIPTLDANVANYVAPIERFKADARAGTLPSFSFLEPIWISLAGTSSYHPGGDLVPGERALNEIYDALRQGPAWNETLFVISFDEHGGIFDHVPPPYATNPWPNDVNDGFRFDLMGPRVPTILVSPWIGEQTVFRSPSSGAYDATSVLATLLKWYGVPPSRWNLGERVQQAPTFEGVLLEAAPRKTSPSFTPPYDNEFPPSGEAPSHPRLHELHRLMAPRLLHALLRDKLDGPSIERLAAQITSDAGDLRTLYTKIESTAAAFGRR